MPLADASSRWTGKHVRGPAVTSLLTVGIEQELGSALEWRPIRMTFELHSPVELAPCRLRSHILKEGRTLSIVESELVDGEQTRVLARCRAAVISNPLHTPHSSEIDPVWTPPIPAECVPPNKELRSLAAHGRLYKTTHTEWSGSRVAHLNADRHLVWYFDNAIIEDEVPTPLQCAARAADLGNYVINAGSNGLGYLNVDVTLSLSRPPTQGGIGVCSELRSAHSGVSVGTAHMFDTSGAFGTTTVTAVKNSKKELNFQGDNPV
ncbi:acyl-CoA thioesterase domain-containing protein [Leucobacter sp. GX24907]